MIKCTSVNIDIFIFSNICPIKQIICEIVILQRKEELLRAADHQSSLLEEAQDTCVEVANKLGDLEEQIKYVHKQVNRIPLLLKSASIQSQ